MWRFEIIDYNIEDLGKTLKNLKNNPYGIKDKMHVFDRARDRGIDVNYVTDALCTLVPVGIEKTHNHSSKFLVI